MNYDAVVVGSGPNGLAAAILLQQHGLSVLLLEGKDTIGGGLRTQELTLPGFKHDVCSAIHPLAAASPFFETLPLQQYGLEYIYPEIAAAHPFDDGGAALLFRSVTETAATLGPDTENYVRRLQPLVNLWPNIVADVLGPLKFPSHPLDMARFALAGLPSAQHSLKLFKGDKAKSFFAGMAAHSILPLDRIGTSAVALVLLIAAHKKGWPLPKGGSVKIAEALGAYFKQLGGHIETGHYITKLEQLPKTKALLFDVGPKQLLSIAGHSLSDIYRWQLSRFKYGAGVFKVDWALDDQVPYLAEEARRAGTVHLGGTATEIAAGEKGIWEGKHAETPFVLLAQQSLFDNVRAPAGKHTAWGYCHVPAGSTRDMTDAIEQQVERFAPGFRDRVLARHTFDTRQMEEYNPNYVGGDINGGALSITQLFTRPVLRRSPYTTSAKGIYLCSSSTPPGGGVHGMCGYYAAKKALSDVFKIKVQAL